MNTAVIPIPASFDNSIITPDRYAAWYKESIEQPDIFWGAHGKRLDWITPYTRVKNVDFKDNARIRWFEDGVLNACVNCVDRHLKDKADQPALLFEGDELAVSAAITYRQLHEEVCRLANALKKIGINKGDRVAIYLPMIPQAVYAMLACARIGAIHMVVFAGFSPQSLRDRLLDCSAKVIITADAGRRGGKSIALKANVDAALAEVTTDVMNVLVYRHTGDTVAMTHGRDFWYHDAVAIEATFCPAEPMGAEDPLFILYTSGSTGKPKGVLHTTGGYLVYAAMTHEYVFDYRPGEVYWCTADVGWITGHSYGVYGPLANGGVTLIFEGVPNYPDWGRFWQVVEKHRVNIFYTAPTAIRALLREGDAYVTRCNRSSLRVLGSVGEPINEEAWNWYHDVVGEGRCPIADTWWQTETGGIMITCLPGAHNLKPAYAGLPFFGIRPALVDGAGNIHIGEAEGNLVILDSWPGQMRTVFGNHQRFIETYFATFPGKYFSGDGARRDVDGYYRITGRVDDVINVSGHRLGTAEIEQALNAHPDVAESAVVGYPHDIKGQALMAFVLLKEHAQPTDMLHKALIARVRQDISPIAAPDIILVVPGLPKTRSGKIMRRVLRKIAEKDTEHLGDTSTLAEPGIVPILVALTREQG
ncbi:MAG: acetate--CoA ligase [Holosporales bacterium]|jgi:acetyl-CoA synthetase